MWMFLGSKPGFDLHDRVHSLIFQAPASAELKFCVGFEEVGWQQVLTVVKSPEGGHAGAGPFAIPAFAWNSHL